MSLEFVIGSIRRTVHRGDDDLLSAGLGLAGLTAAPVAFAEPAHPTAAELRRRAIQMTWKGIADLGPLGEYGRVYGSVPTVLGREFSAFARLPHAHHLHRVLCQIPDHFNSKARCLVLAPSSGSRGIYGAMALAGAWGLPRGCAVAYTDKATGAGYFDCADGSGVTLDGTRVQAGAALLEFEPPRFSPDTGIAVKHAHSGDLPEADWGSHVLQAARFGLAMLDETFPMQAPFTVENTRIIAVGVSNGGGAVLQAAGLDPDGWLDGVVALEPNVHVAGQGRALYDYATEAALFLPCALSAAEFATIPFARTDTAVPSTWSARGMTLQTHGLLQSRNPETLPREALERLRATGWQDSAIATAACSTAFDLWRAIAATYASAYLRASAGAMPCGFSFQTIDTSGVPGIPTQAVRAAWWSDGTGIPPDLGIGLFCRLDAAETDPAFPGALALRELWSGSDMQSTTLHAAVNKLSARLPRKDLPIWVIHGAEDGLIPAAFTSDAYIGWLRTQGREPHYWRIPHAQHFDAFLALPDFGNRYVPLLPYGYFALDRLYAHITTGAALIHLPTPQTRPRGERKLESKHLDLPT